LTVIFDSCAWVAKAIKDRMNVKISVLFISGVKVIKKWEMTHN
jgi:hypothetical protein